MALDFINLIELVHGLKNLMIKIGGQCKRHLQKLKQIYTVLMMVLAGLSMGMSFLWESDGKRPMGWDGTGINCYGMGMGQINMSQNAQSCISDYQILFIL